MLGCQKIYRKNLLGIIILGVKLFKSKTYLYTLAIIFVLFAVFQVPSFRCYVDSYAVKATEKRFGRHRLSVEKESMIRELASEMGIGLDIKIRKMNASALQLFGYYNAFAYYPHAFLDLFPISRQPFLYVSEGFFQTMSTAEQRFLIGHELIHVRDRHLRGYYLWFILCVLLLLSAAFVFYLHVLSRIQWAFIRLLGIVLSIYLVIIVPYLGGLAYKRHIERVADIESLKILNTYDGCLQLIDRWQCDFDMPEHTTFDGWLSDHPSCFERKKYCLELKGKNEK